MQDKLQNRWTVVLLITTKS